MSHSPRVTPTSLLLAITVPLEGCLGSHQRFKLEQPGPCPRASRLSPLPRPAPERGSLSLNFWSWFVLCVFGFFFYYALEIVGKAHGQSLSPPPPPPCVFHCTECQDGFIGITGLDRHSLMTVIGNYAQQWHSPGNFPLQALLSPQSTEGDACKRIIF